MSAVIQRRRVHAKVSKLDAKQPSIYEPNTYRYRQYLTTFNNFENNFNKNFLEGNIKGLKSILANFHKSFKKNELLLNDLCHKHTDATEQNNNNVFLIQRSNKLVNLLLDYFLNKRYTIVQNRSEQELCSVLTQENQDVIILTVKILKAFAMVNPVFGKLLTHNTMFIETLLSLTLQNHKLYFKQTLRILEALVRYNPGAITQDMYHLILDMISSLPKKHLARFSRIIALVLLENSNKMDFNELSLGFSESKTSKMHSLLLSTSNFLESYVFTLESLKQTIKSLTSINSDNLSKTLSYLKESGLIKNSAVDLRVLKPIFEQCKTVQNLISEVFASEFIIKFAVSKSNITEILYIISSLLAGRRRIDVHEQLNQLDFFNRVLDPFFEILFHPSLQLEDPEDPSNANNPLSTARIQFIRVLANFCERSSSRDNLRDLLVTEEEKTLLNSEVIWNQTDLKTIEESSSLFSKENLKQNLFENVSNKGLLQKIIEVLKKINPNTSYYTWLCSCLETFLRGADPSYQVFVAHTGLLSHLLEKLVKNQVTVSSNIQATYDLIAEVFKYNTYNILFLEKLCQSFGWRPTLFSYIQKNVVNSNVFLRSVILSYEKLRMTATNKQVEDYLSLFKMILDKKDQLMSNLFQVVVSESITKDNLCSLNTVLTMAIFAEQEGNLHTYINKIIGKGSKFAKEQIKEFWKQLNTWLQYYLSNTQARFVLESATSVKFIYFQDIAEKIQILFKEYI